jgi:2'-5' RNA ligase
VSLQPLLKKGPRLFCQGISKQKKCGSTFLKMDQKALYYMSMPIDASKCGDLSKMLSLIQEGDRSPFGVQSDGQFHLTLHVKLPESVNFLKLSEEIKKKFSSFEINLNKLDFFTSKHPTTQKEQDVLVVKVQTEEKDPVMLLHKFLVYASGVPFAQKTFEPHITLAFLQAGKAKKYIDSWLFSETLLIVDRIDVRRHLGLNDLLSTIKLGPPKNGATAPFLL